MFIQLIALECAGQALGRLLCAVCRKQVTANSVSSGMEEISYHGLFVLPILHIRNLTLSSTTSILSFFPVIILVFGTVGGFMPPFKMITPFLRWLSWLTPVSYAFEGLMLNESMISSLIQSLELVVIR